MKEKGIFIGALVSLVLFILIALNFNGSFLTGFDNGISLFSVLNQNEFFQIFSIFISKIFEPAYVIIFVILLSVLLFFKSKKRQAIILSLSSLLAGASIYLLKHVFSRERPLNQIIQETGFSFPSGHAMISVALFGTLMFMSFGLKSRAKRIASIVSCILAILIIGLSRVYLNVHWFSDVAAGYCFGLFLVFAVLFGEKIIKRL
jgi:undecaprenyl-diphosphatase